MIMKDSYPLFVVINLQFRYYYCLWHELISILHISRLSGSVILYVMQFSFNYWVRVVAMRAINKSFNILRNNWSMPSWRRIDFRSLLISFPFDFLSVLMLVHPYTFLCDWWLMQEKHEEEVLINEKLKAEISELKQLRVIRELPQKMCHSLAMCKDVYMDILSSLQVQYNLIPDFTSPNPLTVFKNISQVTPIFILFCYY